MNSDINHSATSNGDAEHNLKDKVHTGLTASQGTDPSIQPTYSIPEGLQYRLNRKNEEIERLMSEVTRLENELSGKNARFRSLELSLESALDDANYAKHKADQFETELTEIKRDLSQKNILLQAAIDDAMAKETLVDQMKTKVAELDSRLVTTQANCDVADEKDITINQLRKRCDELSKRLDEHIYLLGREQNLRIEQTQRVSELEQERAQLLMNADSTPQIAVNNRMASTSHDSSTFLNMDFASTSSSTGVSPSVGVAHKQGGKTSSHWNYLIDDAKHYFQSSPFWREMIEKVQRIENKQLSDTLYMMKNALRRERLRRYGPLVLGGYLTIVHLLAVAYLMF